MNELYLITIESDRYEIDTIKSEISISSLFSIYYFNDLDLVYYIFANIYEMDDINIEIKKYIFNNEDDMFNSIDIYNKINLYNGTLNKQYFIKYMKDENYLTKLKNKYIEIMNLCLKNNSAGDLYLSLSLNDIVDIINYDSNIKNINKLVEYKSINKITTFLNNIENMEEKHTKFKKIVLNNDDSI